MRENHRRVLGGATAIVALLAALSMGMQGCGQTTSTSTSSSGGSSTASGLVSLTGKLLFGSIQTSSLGMLSIVPGSRPQASSSDTESVLAQSAKDGKIYYGTVDSSGNLSISVPSGEAIYIDVLKNGRFDGMFVATAEGSQDTMGIKPTTSTNLGNITIDESKGIALSSSSEGISKIKDATLTARASSGVPVGAGNFGKGTGSKLGTGSADSTKLDEDRDGLPDFLDADNDGNGLVDEMDKDSKPESEGAAGLTQIQQATVFMNLKIDYDKTATFNRKTDTVLTLHVQVKDPSKVSKVEVVDAPAYKDTATSVASSFTFPDHDYPAEGTSWKSLGYKLVKATMGGATVWTMFISPVDNVSAGDTFHFRVTFTDGTTEDAVKMINYAFTNIPKLATVNGTAATAFTGTNGTISDPIGISSSTSDLSFPITWSRPLDESGIAINGMTYQMQVFYYNAAKQSIGQKNFDGPVDDATGSVTMQTTLSLKSSDVTTEAAAIYQVDLTAQSKAGDNSAQKTDYKKK